jgi:hypothetical protein
VPTFSETRNSFAILTRLYPEPVKSVHIFKLFLFNIHLDNIVTPMLRRPSDLFAPDSALNFCVISHIPRAWYRPLSLPHPLFRLPHNSWWRVQIMKLLIIQFSLFSCNSISIYGVNILLGIFSQTPSVYSLFRLSFLNSKWIYQTPWCSRLPGIVSGQIKTASSISFPICLMWHIGICNAAVLFYSLSYRRPISVHRKMLSRVSDYTRASDW